MKILIHAVTFEVDFYKKEAPFLYERFFENFGDISINATFIRNSKDIFEYTFDASDKINSSYTNFVLVSKDIKPGYTII